jgi:bleomycin hydrolase
MSKAEKFKIRDQTIKQIYGILSKYLGSPPQPKESTQFDWLFTDDSSSESNKVSDLNPLKFKNMFLNTLDLHDFVVLMNIPDKDIPYYHMYELQGGNNVEGGRPFTFMNVPINELKKYSMKSITKGMPVWFAADVGKDFNFWLSSLNSELMDRETTFGRPHRLLNKSQRVKLRQSEANHAMVLTGFNTDNSGIHSTAWQVENSWGYWDEEVPGMDGFLSMTDQWFNDNVFQVVIHKKFMSRTINRVLLQEPTTLPPWNIFAPAMQVSGRSMMPVVYRDKERYREQMAKFNQN